MKTIKILFAIVIAFTCTQSINAQTVKDRQSVIKDTVAQKAKYACPMHPEFTSNKPGKCPKCGMDMKKIQVDMKAYSCSMHPEITSDKPGKCPKCGMDLTKTKGKKS